MKRVTRIVALVLAMTMMLVSCGSSDDGTKKEDGDKKASTTETGSSDKSLQKVKDKGKLVLGLDASFPPMGFKDDDQKIVGFDIDLAKEVAKRMGVELVTQPINWDSKEMELDSENIDCIWNGMSYSKQREETMTLSKPYMTNRQVVVVLNKSNYKKLSDLAGKTVDIQSGSTANDAMESDKNKKFADSIGKLIKIEDNVKAMLDMEINGADAVAMDEVVAKYYIEKNAGKFRVLDETLADEQYVIGFKKGSTALCQEVEKQLKAMKADGTIAKISKQWFGEDLTTIE